MEDRFPSTTPGNRSVRFSLAEGLGDNQGDENVFRVPALPITGRKSEPRPLSTTSEHNVTYSVPSVLKPSSLKKESAGPRLGLQSFSPSNSATHDKMAAKLEKLRRQNEQRKAIIDARRAASPSRRVDLAATERSFVGGPCDLTMPHGEPTAVSDMRLSDVSGIFAPDRTYTLTPRPNAPDAEWNGPVSSTPFRSARKLDFGDPNDTPIAVDAITPQASFSTAAVTPSHGLLTKAAPLSTPAPMGSQTDLMLPAEREQKQFDALSTWSNMILKAEDQIEEVDLGKTKEEAQEKLRELLKAGRAKKDAGSAGAEPDQPKTYYEFVCVQKIDQLRRNASALLSSTSFFDDVCRLIDQKNITIRSECNVFSDVGVHTNMLRILLSFNPLWLQLGLETVFAVKMDYKKNGFAAAVSRLLSERLFRDARILRNKKYAQGTVRMMLTPAGRQAMDRHFLSHLITFLFFVEKAKAETLIGHDPRMFTRSSKFKSIDDVFCELSRDLLSASGQPLIKCLPKIGFKPTHKQGFFDEYEYRVNGWGSLSDGVIYAKLVELVYSLPCHSLICRLRVPGGDRLRKIGNMNVALQAALDQGVDMDGCEVTADRLVGCQREATLTMLWKLVGVYVAQSVACDGQLRRLSLALGQRRHSVLAAADEQVRGEHLAFHLCTQLGEQFGIQVSSWCDLRDGRVLAGAWREMNPHAVDIRMYQGDCLLDKVINAAVNELQMPAGLYGGDDRSLALFTHLFLQQLNHIKQVHDAAVRIQRAFRAHRMMRWIYAQVRAPERVEQRRREQEQKRMEEEEQKRKEEEQRLALVEEMKMREEAIREQRRVLAEQQAAAEAALREREAMEEEERLRRGEENLRQQIRELAATTIQSVWRGVLGRRRFVALVEQQLADERTLMEEREQAGRDAAATLIQCKWRGVLARREFAAMLEEQRRKEKLAREAEEQRRREEEEEERQRLAELERLREEEERMQYALEQERLRKVEEEEMLRLEAEERQRLAELAMRQSAAIKIQSYARALSARRLAGRMRAEREANRHAAAVVIQKYARRMLAVRMVGEMRWEKAEEERLEREEGERRRRHDAAVRIQCAVRGLLARRRVRVLRAAREAERRQAAAVVIQSAARGMIARRVALHMRTREHERETSRRHEAAVTIQCAARGFLARRLADSMRTEKMEREEKERLEREKHARREQEELERAAEQARREKEERERAEKEEAARQLMLIAERAECKRRTKAAVCIQRHVRGLLARRVSARIREELCARERLVVRVQCAVRGWLARRQLRKLRADRRRREMQDELAALRAHRERRCIEEDSDVRLRALLREVRELAARQARVDAMMSRFGRVVSEQEEARLVAAQRSAAATRIQARVRGWLARNRLLPEIELRRRNAAMYAAAARSLEWGVASDLARPVGERLEEACVNVLSGDLLLVKRAAFAINRIVALDPLCARLFCVEYNGVAIGMDVLDSITRGIQMDLITGWLWETFVSLLSAEDVWAADSQVRHRVLEYGEELIEMAMLSCRSYWQDPTIVGQACTFLIVLFQMEPTLQGWCKMAYFLCKMRESLYRPVRGQAVFPDDSRLFILDSLEAVLLGEEV